MNTKESMIQFPVSNQTTLTEEEKKAVIALLQKSIDKITTYETLFDHVSPTFVKDKELYQNIVKKLES